MSDYTEIKRRLSRTEELERELNLKRLQVNRLLTITQAINDNVKAIGLFEMYRSFLGWEMGVEKMLLYYRKDDEWAVATSLGLDEALLKMNVSSNLEGINRTNQIIEKDHPLLSHFDVIIPVNHKATPIAYALIGGFSNDDELYNKVQFITTITNIIAVAIENKRLFKQQLEQERLRRELELAREMQLALIPKELPTRPEYELSSIYRPHHTVGGDYFDFIEFEDDKMVFCIGDISGKGAAAALLMANFQANFHTLIRKRRPLKDFIEEINCSLLRTTKGEKFITFFIAEYDPKAKVLKYVNSGHNPPIMVNKNGTQKLGKGSTILGIFEQLPFLNTGEVKIDTDTLILTYTDGLTDLEDVKGKYLTEELVETFVLKNKHLSASQFNQNLINYIEEFKGTMSYPDDFTVLTCKIFQED